jgi:tetratricopeptide (TPR) repeat protein
MIINLNMPAVENLGLGTIPPADSPKAGLSVLVFILLILLLIAVFSAAIFIYRNIIGKRRQTTLREDYTKEAEQYEKSGRFVSAAALYENQLKDKRKAAQLYEKGGDYRRAALLYDLLGIPDKAREMYEKDGDIQSAAEISVLEGDYEEAAKLYYNAGKKIDAALILEKAGRRMAAARTYREAGDYKKAAQLLEGEGMLREAAEMFGIALTDKKIEDSIDDFYTYALKLERAGQQQMALKVFQEIDRINPLYRDVREKLGTLAPLPSEKGDAASKTTLRSFIRNGKFEPRHALKLWVHILKALQEAYRDGKAHGPLSPDTIAIDLHNHIFFLSGPVSTVYASPETLRGAEPDACSDIYTAGIILYEMLMGDLDGLGSARIIDSVENVPEWLDELVLKCIRKVREDRYQDIEAIFGEVKALSKRKGSDGME